MSDTRVPRVSKPPGAPLGELPQERVAGTPIQHVSDTAFWVANYRAEETRRANPLFRDPLAQRLVAGRGEEIARRMRYAAGVAWSVVIRTVIIDELLQGLIASGVDTVVNLGAGLDTRPYRMELPPSLSWVEVDFESVIHFKQERLSSETPRCQLRRLSADLSQPEARAKVLDEIAGAAKRAVVLTEGVVLYLSLEQAGALAKDLSARPVFEHWMVDRFSRAFMQFRARRGFQSQLQNAPLQFDPGDWDGFFAGFGWRAEQTRFVAAESRRLGRAPPVPWPFRALMRLLPARQRLKYEQLMGYALLGRIAR